MRKRYALGLALVIMSAGRPPELFPKGREPARTLSVYGASGWVVYWDKKASVQAALDHAEKLDEISVFAADFDEDYTVKAYPEVLESIRQLKQSSSLRRPRILITVVNDVRSAMGSFLKNPDCIHAILSSGEKRAVHIDQLLELSGDADGIEIDYESLYLKDRDAFTLFVRDLADKLHQRGKWLSVVVEAKTSDVLKDREGAMSWEALGRSADSIKIMAYLYHYPTGKPGPLAPPDWVVDVARFAVTQIPVEKLTVALTMQGCDWGNAGKGKMLTYPKVTALIEKNGIFAQRDAQSASPYFLYAEDGSNHEVWFEDKISMAEKVKRLREIGVRNIAFWYLGSGDPMFLKEITPR